MQPRRPISLKVYSIALSLLVLMVVVTAVSLLRISRDRDGALKLGGRSWQEDGTLSARYWSEAANERKDPPGVFYYWKGERPRHPNARTSGVYLRADPADLSILDGRDDRQRAELIAERLRHWKSITNAGG